MQSTKSTLSQTLLGRGTTVRSIPQLMLCFALLVWAGPALGAKLRVPSTRYPTIQAAIDQARPKDDIEVAPGTYYENIDFHGKAVRVYGREGTAATTIDGGGNGSVVTWANGETADTILEGFTITGGYAYYGAGMYVYYSSPTVTHCTFSSNSARYGGGMYNEGSSPTVTDCTFSANWAGSGGGMYNSGSSPTVTHCTFSSNWAIDGGGICGYGLTVANCTFSGNYGEWGGGIDGGSLTVTNCAFVGNDALYVGGGIHGGNLTVTNCTFVGNSAGYDGGGICGYGLVTNCILWSDSGGEIDYGSADVTVAYSDIQGGFAGEGNIDADPLLDDAGHLQVGSPCIDAGNSAAVPDGVTTDLDGDRRIRGTSVDMGAYESSYKTKKTKH
jgi:hypothetical protein